MRYLAFLIGLLLCATTTIAGPSELTLGMNQGSDSRTPLTVLEATYAKLGIEVIAKAFPARRSLTEADRGNTDGEVSRIAAIEDQHPNLIRVTVPIDYFTVVAITHNLDISIDRIEDLAPYRVGIRTGIRFAEKATAHLPDVVRLAEWDTLFDLLAMGRLDVVIATPLTWQLQTQREGMDNLHILQPPLDTINLYHYLHKRHADLVPVVARTLQNMQSSGELKKLQDKE